MKDLIRKILKEEISLSGNGDDSKKERFKQEYCQPHIGFANTPSTKARLEANIYKKYGYTNKKEYYITTNERGELVVKLKA